MALEGRRAGQVLAPPLLRGLKAHTCVLREAIIVQISVIRWSFLTATKSVLLVLGAHS